MGDVIMLKMIVVEDETILREGICRVGKWDECGIEIVGAAANGKQALEMIEKEMPDILLSDVVMPVMDGLELTKEVYERYPDIRVILLSGHEEFDFVRKAMEYKACNYLLKPVKIEKLMEVVASVRDEIISTRRLKSKLEESAPIMRQHYINQLIGGLSQKKEQIGQRFGSLSIELELEDLSVLVCEPDSYMEDRMELEMTLMALQEISSEVMASELRTEVSIDMKDRLIIICNKPSDMSKKDFVVFLQGKALRIQKEIFLRNAKSVSVGISRLITDVSRIAVAYRDAEKALSYRFFMGEGSIIFIGDVEKRESGNALLLKEKEELLTGAVSVGDIEGTTRYLTAYFAALSEYASQGREYIMDRLKGLISMLDKSIEADASETADAISVRIGEMSSLLSGGDQYMTLDKLHTMIEEQLTAIATIINDDRLLRNEGIIEKAKKYIRQDLGGDVSLITVAESVFVSPNYLSFLFKESGENFKDYVVRVKMERARELIEEDKCTLNQAAGLLGYKDGRYLSRVYKKYWEDK